MLSRASTEVLATEDDNSSDSCYMFSATEIQDITTARIVVSSAAVAMCLVGIIVILALRQYRTFVHRLAIYLMVAALLQGTSTGLEVVPVHHNGTVVEVRHGFHDACVAIGFAGQVTEWQIVMVFSWIIVYLILLAIFKYRANSKRHEIAGLVVSLLVPLTINWLPFIHNMYGLAGPWCWIRTTNKDCRDHIKAGVIYQFTLLYGPQILLILVSFVSFLAIVITVCRQVVKQSRDGTYSQHSPYHQALKESLPLLVYAIIYYIITAVMVINRIYYAITTAHGKPPYYPLWFAHAIAQPLRILFIALAFLLHPGTIRKLLTQARGRFKRSDDSETVYQVPQEPSFSEVEPLIIRGSISINQSSDYKSIFDSDNAN